MTARNNEAWPLRSMYRFRLARRLRSRAARLWTQFPGEIVGDEFASWLERLAADPSVETILEIGSGAGDGSTRAFVAGAVRRSTPPALYCVETVASRAEELRRRYADESFVTCYVAASAGPEDYLSESTSLAYLEAVSDPKTRSTPEQVILARNYELRELATTGISTNAIDQIRQDHGIDTFDVVLLDGSGFCGQRDLAQVYGARWLLLDDTMDIKNLANCVALCHDPGYKLIAANPKVRNGFAVFERVPS